jgi:hypothetical protein
MKHSEFRIGCEFTTGAGRWRCTDVGTRTIIAISLEPRETVEQTCDDNGIWHERRYLSNDPRDLIGPPYSIVEHVFDEYDFEGCEPV